MRLKSIVIAAALGSALPAMPANAVDFYYWDYGGLTQNAAAEKSYTVAMNYWASVLTDDVTVNLLIAATRFDDPRQVTYAAAQWDQTTLSTTEWVYKALAADSKTTLDASAVANLSSLSPSAINPGFNAVTVIANGFNEAGGYADGTVRVDDDGSANNLITLVNRANAKAMNLEFASGQIIDETVTDAILYYSTDVTFDYDPTDGIDAGAYDFTGLAIRDIAVALGLDSYNTVYDDSTGPATTAEDAQENGVTAKTIDHFRYSAADMLDWSTSDTDKYFSIDGGNSQLFGNSRYHTGEQNGDGASATYWRGGETGALGIMDAYPGTGTGMSVTALDLAAVDAIGWDLNFDVLANSGYSMSTADIYRAMTAVPESGTWLQMILGFGLIGGISRYRRRPVAVVA